MTTKNIILAALVFGAGILLLKNRATAAPGGQGVPKIIQGQQAYFLQNILSTQGDRIDLYQTQGGQVLDQYGRTWT